MEKYYAGTVGEKPEIENIGLGLVVLVARVGIPDSSISFS